MLKKITRYGLYFLLLFIGICCREESRVNQVFLLEQERNGEQTNNIISFKIIEDNGFFRREEIVISLEDNCIKSLKEKRFKLKKNILFNEQNINNQNIWYPYLLINDSNCITYSKIDHFGTLNITNCLEAIEGNKYLVHQIQQRVNGDVEKESLITLSQDWLPTNIKYIKVPFGERLLEYTLINHAPEKYYSLVSCY